MTKILFLRALMTLVIVIVAVVVFKSTCHSRFTLFVAFVVVVTDAAVVVVVFQST